MSRLIGRQLFRTLRSPPRNPPRHPFHRFLYYPLRLFSSQHTHSAQYPSPGLQSYDTLIRRFSSRPNPQEIFDRKRQQEAIDRGEYVDVHDVNEADLKDYDVLISDLHDMDLRSGLSEVLGINYLAKATEAQASQVVERAQGVAFGSKKRPIFPCVVSYGNRAHWIFFLVDHGAPLTYLSEQACDVLGLDKDLMTTVKIAGYHHPVQMSPKNSHFRDINLLGWDFSFNYELTARPHRSTRTVNFFFGDAFEKSKL